MINTTFRQLLLSSIRILDPSPYLFVSFEMKKEDSLKPYDPKKSVWVPDGEGGFDEALITEVMMFMEWDPAIVLILSPSALRNVCNPSLN
jgi:hypothetical protein